MRFGSFVTGLVLALGLGAAPAAAKQTDGTIVFDKYKTMVTFNYSTPHPDPKNWIGVYPLTGGPDNDVQPSMGSLVWAYTPNTNGTIQISPGTKLTVGKQYKAYLLAKDKYESLAEPITFTLLAAPATPGAPGADGTLAFLSDQALLTFSYSTPTPGSKNWVGIYKASGGGPENQTYVSASLAWAYATASSGNVQISPDDLTVGETYKAFFLANDGYEWLAEPVTFVLPSAPGGGGGGGGSGVDGTLEFLADQPLMTFKYSTPHPDATNWVGVYLASGGGPDNGVYGGSNSLSWVYTPSTNGTAKLDTTGLTPGKLYKAYFLAKDKYSWLAEPVTFSLPRTPGQIDLIVDSITLRNARVGDAYTANLTGLIDGTLDLSLVDFSWVAGGSATWISVSDSGVVTGVPTSADGGKTAHAYVTFRVPSGVTTLLEIFIPVKAAGAALVDQVNVLTFNLWNGGVHVNDYHRKQVQFLANGNFDIVGLQESTGDHGVRLANALGWDVWQGADCAIISRYPIAEKYTELSAGGGVRIALDGDKSQINVWNVHLDWQYYGPYGFCFDNATTEQVLSQYEGKSNRPSEIQNTISAMQKQLDNANSIPVVLVGDFNSPSHQDYTKAAASAHCGAFDVAWPASKVPTEAGLVDAFRALHPDPVADPAITWSPIYLTNDLESTPRPEPLDRIDLIFSKGSLNVTESGLQIVGKPTAEPNSVDNEWTSDHAAFNAVFQLGVKPPSNCKRRRRSAVAYTA